MIDTEKYKKELEKDLQTLTEELESIGVKNPDNPKDWIATPDTEGSNDADSNVTADVAEEWGSRRATLSHLEIRYANVLRALKKIEEGTYGVCEVSGGAIDPARLDANPAARTCEEHMDQEEDLPL